MNRKFYSKRKKLKICKERNKEKYRKIKKKIEKINQVHKVKFRGKQERLSKKKSQQALFPV